MYIIKFADNRPDETFIKEFPLDYAQDLWHNNTRFIIISNYSNTIRVPRRVDYNDYGENEVTFDEYHFKIS